MQKTQGIWAWLPHTKARSHSFLLQANEFSTEHETALKHVVIIKTDVNLYVNLDPEIRS